MRLRLGLKALGLCALMAAFMAISAGAAQAEPGSEWDVEGTPLSETPELNPELKGKLENKLGSLLTIINGLHLEVHCEEGALNGVVLKPGGGTNNTGDVSFGKCTVYKALPTREPIAGCEVRSEGQAKGSGKILSLPGKALLGLHESEDKTVKEKPVTHIIPNTGIFAHLIFEEEESGEACGFGPLKALIGGELVVEDCTLVEPGVCEDQTRVSKIMHLIREEPELSNLWIFNEEHEATLDGSAEIELTGAHTGLNWNGLPN